MRPYDIVKGFESELARFVGAKHAIAVDSCTNALFLCAKYLNVANLPTVELPSRTYISVPWAIINAGGKVKFVDYQWEGYYWLRPYNIIDSACMLSRNMYISGTHTCVSFSYNKILNIGKGGMIFTDDDDADKWFRLYRYEGREECPIDQQSVFEHSGYNMYMTPEQASKGLTLMQYLENINIVSSPYPDLSKRCRHPKIVK